MQSLHNHRLSCGAMLLGESMPEIESAALAIFTPSGAIHDPPHGCGVAAVAGELMFRGAGDRSGRKLIDDLVRTGHKAYQRAIRCLVVRCLQNIFRRYFPSTLTSSDALNFLSVNLIKCAT